MHYSKYSLYWERKAVFVDKNSQIVMIKCLLTFLILFIQGCSSVTPPAKTSTKLAPVTRNFGPTNSNVTNGFVDVTKRIGLSGIKGVHFYSVDLNFDGYSDLVALESFYSAPRFFSFNPKKKKFEKFKSDPVDKHFRASYLNFIDFDKDGVVDLLAATLNQKSELSKFPVRIFRGIRKNRGIRFKEVLGAFKTGPLPTASVVVLDYDLDGYLDIFLGNWFQYLKSGITQVSRDYLFKGQGLKFVDKSDLLTDESKEARPTFGASACDLDQNGFPDILTASSSRYGNKMWMNVGSNGKKRSFKDYGGVSGFSSDDEGRLNPKGGGNSFFANCTDYNNDGIMDVVMGELSHSYDNEDQDRSTILTGAQFKFPPSFIRSEYYMEDGSDRWNQGDRRGVWFDYNNDGLIDLLVDNSGFPPKSRMILFEQAGNHSFDNLSKVRGVDIVNPAGSIVVDFNKDGRQDIITGQSNVRDSSIKERVYLFENRIKNSRGRALRVHLKGRKSNIDGIGAVIDMVTDRSVQKRFVHYNYGGLPSQNQMGTHFGVDLYEKLKTIKVYWPILIKDRLDRKIQLIKEYDLTGVPKGDYLELTLFEDGRLEWRE